MKESQNLYTVLRDLEQKRLKNEITLKEFYLSLLKLLADLEKTLIVEEISEKQIKKQIPLLLAFLKYQIAELEHRGH